jgi:hypothetical protein
LGPREEGAMPRSARYRSLLTTELLA